MLKVWAIYANEDSTEGRGRDVLVEICATEELALRRSKGLGPMGMSDGTVKPTYVLETNDDAVAVKMANARDKALAKLTDEDKHALGLK